MRASFKLTSSAVAVTFCVLSFSSVSPADDLYPGVAGVPSMTGDVLVCDEVACDAYSCDGGLCGSLGMDLFGEPSVGILARLRHLNCGDLCFGIPNVMETCYGTKQEMKRICMRKRMRWFLRTQDHKKLLHPECPPLNSCHYGYYPTCWRPMTEVPVCPCPMPGEYAPSMHGMSAQQPFIQPMGPPASLPPAAMAPPETAPVESYPPPKMPIPDLHMN